MFINILSLLFAVNIVAAQGKYTIKATVEDPQKKSLQLAGTVDIQNTNSTTSIINNAFKISVNKGNYIIKITVKDYSIVKLPITITNDNIDLGTIYLQKDITVEKVDNLITLTDAALSEEETSTITSGLLQATRDVFLSRAAFDFGQAFFRVRGYDSKYSKVLINGIAMNNISDGRPQWNNWG
ncbi:hypothetical protein A5M85_05880 [Cellulophaga lytica]|nr:hypothetical protein A5M85_05880 [Cellulophaga lytica]